MTEVAATAAGTATAASGGATGGQSATTSTTASTAATSNGTTQGQAAGATQQATTTSADAPSYDGLKAPEGFDAALVPKFIERAKVYGISPEKAQVWIEDAAKNMAAQKQAMDAALAKQREEWHSEIKADKTIGGEKFQATLQRAQQVVDKIDANIAPGIKKILADTGYGDHPAVVRLFAHLGEQAREDTFVSGGGQSAGQQKQLHQILYPATGG